MLGAGRMGEVGKWGNNLSNLYEEQTCKDHMSLGDRVELALGWC